MRLEWTGTSQFSSSGDTQEEVANFPSRRLSRKPEYYSAPAEGSESEETNVPEGNLNY